MEAMRFLKDQLLLARARPSNAAFRSVSEASTIGRYKRVFHYHIRKTAGTSINYAFLSIGGEPGRAVYSRLAHNPTHRTISGKRAFVGFYRPLIEQGYYHYAFSHTAAHELSLPPDTFTITCLRDPLKRLLSHYQMLREFVDTDTWHGCLNVEGPWLGRSFDDFLSAIPREHCCRQLYMFSQKFDPNEAIDRVRRSGYYFFTEEFVDGMAKLSSHLHEDLPVLHARPTRIAYEIPARALDRARDLLSDEYEMIDALRMTNPAL